MTDARARVPAHGLLPFDLAMLRACAIGPETDLLPFEAANAALEKLIAAAVLLPDGRLTALGTFILGAEK